MTLTVPFFLLLVATIAGALETASLTSKSSISLTSQHFTEASPTGEFETTSYDTIAGVTNGHVTIPAKTIAISFPTCIQTITPDKNGYLPPGTCNALWDYYPSFVTAVAFSVLFGALTTIHIGQAVKYRKKFCWVVISFGVWETMALTFRALSTRYQHTVGIYLVFQIFILLGPLWINAFAYMVLSRMIHFFLPSGSLFSVPAQLLAIIFVSLDFVALVIQLVGGSWAGPTAPVEEQMKGVHIYMGGIAFQQCCILVFYGLAAKFQRQMGKMTREKLGDEGLRVQWKRLLFTLYGVLGLITVRILFRLIEFSSGTSTSNPITKKEAYFYVFEAVPMLLALLAFVLTHPGTILQGRNSELPGIWLAVRMKFGSRKGHELLLDSVPTGRH